MNSPKSLAASSLLTLGKMITSDPGFQLAGVVTFWYVVSCKESITRMISSKLRPQEAFQKNEHKVKQTNLCLFFYRIDENQANNVRRIDDEDSSHGQRKLGLLVFRSIVLVSKHAVKSGDFALRIHNDGKVHLDIVDLFNVLIMQPTT